MVELKAIVTNSAASKAVKANRSATTSILLASPVSKLVEPKLESLKLEEATSLEVEVEVTLVSVT